MDIVVDTLFSCFLLTFLEQYQCDTAEILYLCGEEMYSNSSRTSPYRNYLEMTEDSLPQAHLVPQGLLPVVLPFIVPHLFGQDNFPQLRLSISPFRNCLPLSALADFVAI